MRLNTLFINLLIVATGITVVPVQADSKNYLSNEWGGLMKVKGSDDRKHREDDDDDRRYRGDDDSKHHEDSNDDRKKKKKYDYSGSQSGYGTDTGSDSSPAIPRNDKPNFKERQFQQRQKEREQGEIAKPVDQQN